MEMAPLPDVKYECRQRDCAFTKADLEDLTGLLQGKYPDLLIFERSYDYKHTKIYRSLAQVDREVEFCERKPDWLCEIEAQDGPQSRITGHSVSQLENPMIRILPSPVVVRDLRKPRPGDCRRPIDFVGRQIPSPGDVQGCHRRGDVEARRFFSAVFRLLAKFMHNSFEVHNLETGAVTETVTGHWWWMGPGFVKMAGDDPGFYAAIWYEDDDDTWLGLKPILKTKSRRGAR